MSRRRWRAAQEDSPQRLGGHRVSKRVTASDVVHSLRAWIELGVFNSTFVHVFLAEAELLEAFLLLHLFRSRGTVTRTIVIDVVSVRLRRACQIRRTDRCQLLVTVAAAELFLRAVCHTI